LLRSCTAENGFPVSELKKRMDEFMEGWCILKFLLLSNQIIEEVCTY
jgi:hypothetical protein